MSMVVHLHAFSGAEADAFAEIRARGWHPLAREVAPEHNEPHFHPFDTMIYIVGGELRFHDVATGELRICPPGTRIDDIGENLHREDHDGYRAIVGFRDDPSVIFGTER
jgi:hypothetical protein